MKYLLIGCALAFLAYLIVHNHRLEVTYYNGKADEDLRIVQLSDIHNTRFGKDNERLIRKIEELEPDVIVITGDLIDKRFPNRGFCYRLAERLTKIADVYYIRGNHEIRLHDDSFEKNIQAIGVRMLYDERVIIGKNIELFGLDDVQKYDRHNRRIQQQGIKDTLKNYQPQHHPAILLAHQPQHFEVYSQYGFDIVLCGHVHGGQIRLPRIGGLYAPGQGIMPEFDGGVYVRRDSVMIVSRGLGRSLFPLRVNNDPQIVVLDLKKPGDEAVE